MADPTGTAAFGTGSGGGSMLSGVASGAGGDAGTE
jgi:hypothetical protein